VVHTTEKRDAFRALVRNAEGKRCLHNTDAYVRVISKQS